MKLPSIFRVMCRSLSMVSTHLPLIVICGSTGTGKSKLAIELARLFGGEVINADVIQLYKGLEIATNKVLEHECQGVPHHMLGILSPNAGRNYDVHEYRAACVRIISQLRDNQKLPILTGGTHYYLESVLWTDFLTNKDPNFEKAASSTLKDQLSLNSEDSHKLLKELNPTRAAQLHPKNLRKIRSALIQELMRQNISDTSSLSSSETRTCPNRSCKPRYPDETIIFWLDCALNVLDQHLNQRVDQMIERGLLKELDSFVNYAISSLQTDNQNYSLDHASQIPSENISCLFSETLENQTNPVARRGILQSIGFKEFADYLSLPASPDGRESDKGKRLLDAAIERVKISTRQYARRQVRWVVNRFLRRPALGGLPVYRLDVTNSLKSNSDTWTQTILSPAVRIIRDYYISHDIPIFQSTLTASLDDLLNQCPPDLVIKPEPFISPPESKSTSNSGPPFICSPCSDRIFNRLEDFEAHCKSRTHQKRVAKLRKQSLLEEVFNKSSRTSD